MKTIGLQHLARENSEVLLGANKESLEKLADVLSRVGEKSQQEYMKDLLLSIKGTMSDRCEVMKKFNRLFGEIREANLKEIGLRYCFLHIIINLGDNACKRGLVDFDKCSLEEETYSQFHKRGNSSTYSAILSAARLFLQQGSEKYGRSDLFEAFLAGGEEDEEGSVRGKSRKNTQILSKKSLFEREVGNRAHITYHNGAALWNHRFDIKSFLEVLIKGENPGEMVKMMYDLIQMKVPLAGARALGIIKACITGPFQAAFDKACTNILDMVPYCLEMKNALERYANDATELITNPASIFPDIPMHLTGWESLFEASVDPEIDALTIVAVQLILRNHQILFERQAELYLEGGEHAKADKDKKIVRNCPMTNRASESNMGFVDREVRIRPNATPGYLDASLIVRTNKTSLEGIADEKKGKVFQEARKWAQEEIESSKIKLKEHLIARKAVIEQCQIVRKDKEVKAVVRKSKVVAEISQYGNEWKSVKEMDLFSEKCASEGEKRKALEAQIRYHKVVLNTDKLFAKEKGHLFKISGKNSEELRSSMREILESSPHYEYLADVNERETSRITGATVLSQKERKELYQVRVKALQEKLDVERRRRLKEKEMEEEFGEEDIDVESDSSSNLGGKRRDTIKGDSKRAKRKCKGLESVPHPEFLVGKRVEHEFFIKEAGKKRRNRLVYTGTVTRIIKRGAVPIYTQYEIIYDVDCTESKDED